MLRHLARWLLYLAIGIVGYWLLGLALFRFVDPPGTPLMLMRMAEGLGRDYRPRPLAVMDADLPRAVVAAEDNRFCQHAGVDFSAVEEAIEDYQDRGRLRGASTITMQVARNLFLWQGGGALRKGLEVPLALALDQLWPKRRIIETYLNIAEWGPGIYGAEAAAQAYFGKPAAALSRHEASLMAAILPSPRRWQADRPSNYVTRRAGIISGRIPTLAPDYFRCFEGG